MTSRVRRYSFFDRVSRQGSLDKRTVNKAAAVTFTMLGNVGLAKSQTKMQYQKMIGDEKS